MSGSTVRPGVATALVVLAGAPAVSSAQSLFESPAATAQLAGVELPMVVDTFDVVRIRATPVAGLGVAASYATPLQTSSDFTLYVFSNGDTLEEQFEGAIDELSAWLEREGDSVTVFTLDERGPVEVEATDGTTYAGYRARGTYERDGSRRRTWLYVFQKGGQLVKHRATTPEADVEVVAPLVAAFVAGTLGEIDVAGAAEEPRGLLWEQEYGPMRIAGLHLPLVADDFAALEIERHPREAGALRTTYRSESRVAPILNVVTRPRRDTALAPVFARAYGPLRSGAERQGLELEEDPLLVCTWGVPGGEEVEGISGGVRIEGPNGPSYVQVIAADVDPWHVTFTLAHPPGADPERGYPPILAEVLARVASEGAAGRVVAEPEVAEAPAGVIGGG